MNQADIRAVLTPPVLARRVNHLVSDRDEDLFIAVHDNHE